ncbi:DNA polymerase III subunit delta, partial ['Camptotheca acuminata' phytoplasma]
MELNHNLNLLLNYQKFFIEEEKKEIKKICQIKNYQFLFFSLDENNYIQETKKIAQELFTGSFFYEKKVLFIENLSLVFSKKNIKFDFIIDFFTKPNEN